MLTTTRAPVLKTTRYDRASAVMVAVVMALIAAVIWVIALYLANRRIVTDNLARIELFELTGGVEDGSPDETLKVESPEEVTDDPSVTDTEETAQIQEVVEVVTELSPNAAQQVQEQYDTAAENTGKAGSADGTGKPALGSGGRGGGVPKHQRWFIRFADRDTIDSYARQLDFFQIELACWKNKRVDYIRNMTNATPSKRSKDKGVDARLNFNWKTGGRRKADIELFRRAGIDARGGYIFHCYEGKTVETLARAEIAAAIKSIKLIRRTYFVVRKEGSGYKFVVTRITYF